MIKEILFNSPDQRNLAKNVVEMFLFRFRNPLPLVKPFGGECS